MTHRWLGVVLTACLGIGMAVVSAGPAAPQSAAAGSIALAAPPRVTTVGEAAIVNLNVSATAGTELRWTVFDAVCSRSELATDVFTELRRPVVGGPVPIPEDGTSLPPIDVVLPTSSERPTTTCASGVFPVTFSLTAGDEAELLDELTVYVTEIDPDDTARHPLSIALHLDVGLPVALQPDGIDHLDQEALASLQTIVDALTLHPDVAVTLTVSPESIEALGKDPTGAPLLADLGAILAGGAQLLPAPYVPLDETAWWQEGLEDVLTVQYDTGADALIRGLGATPSPRTILASPSTTTASLDEYRNRGAKAIVIAEENLAPLASTRFPLTITQRFVLRTASGQPLPAAQIDARSATLFGDGVYEAHRLLTDLDVLGFDQPNTPRGVVLRPPPDWRPTRDFLVALLSGLRDDPILEPVTFDDYFAPGAVGVADRLGQIDREGTLEPLERSLRPSPTESTDGYLGVHSLFSAGLESYAAIRGDEGTDEIAALAKRILVAGSDTLAREDRDAYFTAVNDIVAQDIAGVTGPDPETITITARRDDIPITIINDLGYSANVVLVLESDKLEFPDGAQIPWTLDPGINDDITIPVRARTSGDSLLQVTVRSPDLRLQLGTTSRVTVRSTALSGLGVVMSIAALSMLMIWWLRQIMRSRRERALGSSLAGAEAGSTEELP